MRSVGSRNEHLVGIGFRSEKFVIFSSYLGVRDNILADAHTRGEGSSRPTSPRVEYVGIASSSFLVNKVASEVRVFIVEEFAYQAGGRYLSKIS